MDAERASLRSAPEPDALDELAGELKLRYGFSPLATFTRLEDGDAGHYRMEDSLRHIRMEFHVFRGMRDTAPLRALAAWLLELSRSYGLLIPGPVPGVDGETVQSMSTGGILVACFATAYWGTAKPYSEAEESLPARFSLLGKVAAQLHQISVQWGRHGELPFAPAPYAPVLEPGGLPRTPGFRERRELLEEAALAVRLRLARYGRQPRRFGMVHGNLLPGSVARVNGRLLVAGLDGAFPGWYLYDCSPALAPYLRSPRCEALLEAWLDGYGEIRKLGRDERDILPTFHMLHLLSELGRGNRTMPAEVIFARVRAYLAQNG